MVQQPISPAVAEPNPPGAPAYEVAVIDACVLFKGKVTDFLLRLAQAGAFEPVWSLIIHDEWMRNLHARMQIPMDRLEYRRSEMDRAFPGAVCAPEPSVLMAVEQMCVTARERKDAHVVATAVAAHATVIVTENLQDFRLSVLARYRLKKLSADAFCMSLFAARPMDVIGGARAHRLSMSRPAYDTTAYLAFLAGKAELPMTASALAAHVTKI